MAESHREEIAKLEALYAGNPGGRVFVHLAEAYRKAGEHERARRILDEGLARHTDSASGYVVLGRVLADMQIIDEAEVAFRRVLELDGGNLVALRWLGDLARQSGRTDEAAAHYRELLARNPSNEEVRDLVEIVEREASPDLPGPRAQEPEWQEPEPVEQVPEASAEPLTPLSAAPGRTGDEEPPEVEFGLVEIEAIEVQAQDQPADDEPAAAAEQDDAPAFAPLEEPGSVEELESAAAASPWADSGSGLAEDDSLVVESAGEEDAEQLAGLARSDETDEIEIHLLDPSYTGDEGGADYADDDFIADLMSAPAEPREPDALDAGALDVLGSSSPLTLQGDEAADDASQEDTAEVSEAPPAWTDAVDTEAETPWATGAELEPAFSDASGQAPEEGDEAEGVAEPSFPEAVEPAPEAAWGEPEVGEPATEAAEIGGAEPPPLKPHGDDLGAVALGNAGDPGPVTETMAELYRAQGFHDRAADVYRALLRQRPFDLRLSQQLSEAEADAAAARASEAAARVAGEPEDEGSGEVWLRGVGASWNAGSTDAPDSATPYAWTDEAEEQVTGQPISSYLRDLVSWKTAGQRWAEAAPPAQPPQPPPQQQQAAWSPDDEPWATAPVDDSWGAEPADSVSSDAAGAEESASPWGEPAAAETGADTQGGEPWSGSTASGQPADADTEPASWLQGGSDPQPDPWGTGQDTGAPAAEATASWSAPEKEPVPEPSPVSDPTEESDAEDEDLEMFRSWLQSLKK